MFRLLFALALLLSVGVAAVAIHSAQYEWGFTEDSTLNSSTGSTSTSTVTNTSSVTGNLVANIQIGPMYPVCIAGTVEGSVPEDISSIQVIITDSSGNRMVLPVSWTSDGCNAVGLMQATLAPGTYQLNLSPCSFIGCQRALPRDFSILLGQTTDVDVSISTGIA